MIRFPSRLLYWQMFVRKKSHPFAPFPDFIPSLRQSIHGSTFGSAPMDFSIDKYAATRFENRMQSLGTLSSSLLCSGRGLFKLGSVGQQKNIFIQTQTTPNPLSLMFFPGKSVMEVGSADFPNSRTGMSSPLAKALFGIDARLQIPKDIPRMLIDCDKQQKWYL